MKNEVPDHPTPLTARSTTFFFFPFAIALGKHSVVSNCRRRTYLAVPVEERLYYIEVSLSIYISQGGKLYCTHVETMTHMFEEVHRHSGDVGLYLFI